MKIRTLTFGIIFNSSENLINKLENKIKVIKNIIQKIQKKLENYEIQTIRIVTNSFENYMNLNDLNSVYTLLLTQLLPLLNKYDINFFNFGPAITKKGIDFIPSLLALSTKFNSSCFILNEENQPSYAMALAAANTTIRIATEGNNTSKFYELNDIKIDINHDEKEEENDENFDEKKIDNLNNFRFCVGFNCPPGIPFFPIGYAGANINTTHTISTNTSNNDDNNDDNNENKITLSIGLECSDLLNLAVNLSSSLNEAEIFITNIFTRSLQPIHDILTEFCDLQEFQECMAENEAYLLEYLGIDPSINPSLDPNESIVNAFNTLGVENFGDYGTLNICSLITKAIKSIPLRLCGYSGLMLPVMEDEGLANCCSNENSKIDFYHLLLFSSVCGTGIDTVPISDKVNPENLAQLYLDVCAMAHRLNKPLACRVLPIIDSNPGDLTNINNPYLTNTRIFDL